MPVWTFPPATGSAIISSVRTAIEISRLGARFLPRPSAILAARRLFGSAGAVLRQKGAGVLDALAVWSEDA